LQNQSGYSIPFNWIIVNWRWIFNLKFLVFNEWQNEQITKLMKYDLEERTAKFGENII
jgi:hypothetical protein